MAKRTVKKNPAVDLAKQLRLNTSNDPVELSTGHWALIKPVSAHLIDGAMALVEDPPVPEVWIEEKGRSELNPSDPAYLRSLERKEVERNMAAADAIILMGMELVTPEGEPFDIPDTGWLGKLKLLERIGSADLSEFDLDDPLDREFVYKKFIAVSAPDLMLLSSASGVNEEAVQKLIDLFPSN
jgi:hypothetical protein